MNENPWKPVTIVLAAAVALLSGTLVWITARNRSGKDARARNVEALARFHLAQKEPEKAAAVLEAEPDAALDVRLEVAGALPPAEAAKLLDAIPGAALDRPDAERVAQARLDANVALFKARLLRNGAVLAPFELGPYRLENAPPEPPEELSRTVSRLLAAIAGGRDLARRHGGSVDPGLARIESLAQVARYALGEISLDALRPADDEVRFQLGDLLYRERQFDRAIETWKPLLGEPRVIRRVAELAALRRFAPKTLHVWDYEAEKLLGRDPKLEGEVAAEVEALFRKARPGVLSHPAAPKVIRESVVTAEPEDPPKGELALDPTQLYLLVDHHQFRLEVPFDRPFVTKAPPTLKLSSAYLGPIRLRLFRVGTIEALRELSEENVVARRSELSPVQEWEKEFAPIRENGKKEETWTFEAPSLGPGLYVLLADARYCPVYAFAKFIVTDIALVQQPALDRVLVWAVDRLTGAPAAGLALEGEVSGQYALPPEELVPKDDSNALEYKRGFEAAWALKAAEPDPTPGYDAGFRRAASLRAAHPDSKLSFKGTTDRDGLFEWTVAPAWRPGYRYAVRTATAAGGSYSRVESPYAVDPKARSLKALVYSDRPLYRPGDTVSFKGILREFDGEGLHPYGGREALFEFGSGGRVLFARSVPTTDFGTASGSFDLPRECPQGYYWARVNNGPQQFLLKVEEFRKPEFEIAFSHPPRVRAGDSVDVEIALRTWSGEPVARTPVSVSLSVAPAGRAEGGWRRIEERSFTTDAAGRCVYRFATDPGIPAPYAVTARAQEESNREVARTTSLESTGQTREVLVESDRPSYFPGETATVRIHAPGAQAARVEERAESEKPFARTIPLEEGRGVLEYPVPGSARDLEVGVREGDGWAWTKVPLEIIPRSLQGGLVTLQLDRALYRVGETAKLHLSSPEREAHVLVTVATGRIHRRMVVRLANSVADVPIEVREEDVPNVGVVAIAYRNDNPGRATAEMKVPPVDRFLALEVATDRDEYRPGQECKATVRVLDSKGRPVPDCEISLGVVDEAIYALQRDMTPDLKEYFHRYERPLSVKEAAFFQENLRTFIVWKAPVFVRGQKNLYDVIAGGAGGGGRYGSRLGGKRNLVAGGGGGGSTANLVPRASFKDTAYWNAHLRTGADGTATVSFSFPDNLTSFRFTARGITKDHKVGSIRQNAVVRKPFHVRLALPRTVQEGNTLAVAGLVRNDTGRPQTLRCSFKAPFPLLRTTAPQSLTLPPGEVARVEYEVSIDRFLESAEFAFGAECDSGEADAVSIAVPGRRHGVPHRDGRSGTLAAGAAREEVFRVPPQAIRGTARLRIDLDPGIHSAILEGLEPLIEYPYGCVEQTMSRFLPAVAVDRALRGAPHRWKEKLPSVVASGLRRLYLLQNPDGRWGWWGGAAHDSMTAYVLYGLAQCRKAGTGVDRTAVDRAAKVLREHLEKEIFGTQPAG
jgi:hypothetical protein